VQQVDIVQEAVWYSGAFWTIAENLAPTGFDPRTVQPVGSHYTDYATRPTNALYINMLHLLSSTACVKVKFFSVKISLMKYNFVLIFFIDFEQLWRGTIQFIPSVFHSYPIHSISVLYSKMAVQKYRVSQEERTKLRESVPYVKLYRYNPKHLYPKLNG